MKFPLKNPYFLGFFRGGFSSIAQFPATETDNDTIEQQMDIMLQQYSTVSSN